MVEANELLFVPPAAVASSSDGNGVLPPICAAAIWSVEIPSSGLAPPPGATQRSQVPALMPCGSELSPGLLRQPLTTVV